MPLRLLLLFGLLWGLLLLPMGALGQDHKGQTPGDVHVSPPRPKKNRAGKLRHILVTNPNKYLVGNRCVAHYTRELGFVYTVSHGEMATARWYHNTLTKIALMFKNGPFWGLRVKRRIKKCRKSSGDFPG